MTSNASLTTDSIENNNTTQNSSRVEMIKMLIEHNTNFFDTTASSGYFPIHDAAYADSTDCITYLAQLKPEVLQQRSIGTLQTPLMVAVRGQNQKAAERLVKLGAQLDLVDSNGQTALHYAARANNLPLVRLLLLKGANYLILDKLNKAAFELCNKEISMFIQRYPMEAVRNLRMYLRDQVSTISELTNSVNQLKRQLEEKEKQQYQHHHENGNNDTDCSFINPGAKSRTEQPSKKRVRL